MKAAAVMPSKSPGLGDVVIVFLLLAVNPGADKTADKLAIQWATDGVDAVAVHVIVD
jgi:hypothetical protein